MIIDEFIAKQIVQCDYTIAKHPLYFQPEIQPFIDKEWFSKYDEEEFDTDWILEIKKEIPNNFYERRKIGENEKYICEIIRKDSIEDFIVYMNKNNYQFNSLIKPSIYETIIEYAAFFGSIQIFNYLRTKGAELTSLLWYYAIHSRNAEIIQIVEENQIVSKNESYKSLFIRSIECHHNDIANYIRDTFLCKVFKKLHFYHAQQEICKINYSMNDQIAVFYKIAEGLGF